MAKHKNPLRITQDEAKKAFSTNSKERICDALLSVALYDKDWKWSQAQCLHFLDNPDSDVRGLAATCLGHIARLHRMLDKEMVVNVLKRHLSDKKISGYIQDALEDIEMFCD